MSHCPLVTINGELSQLPAFCIFTHKDPYDCEGPLWFIHCAYSTFYVEFYGFWHHILVDKAMSYTSLLIGPGPCPCKGAMRNRLTKELSGPAASWHLFGRNDPTQSVCHKSAWTTLSLKYIMFSLLLTFFMETIDKKHWHYDNNYTVCKVPRH